MLDLKKKTIYILFLFLPASGPWSSLSSVLNIADQILFVLALDWLLDIDSDLVADRVPLVELFVDCTSFCWSVAADEDDDDDCEDEVEDEAASFMWFSTVCWIAIGEIHSFGMIRSMKGT